MQNNEKSTKSDLYTELYTLSTGFLCKLWRIIMVTCGTSVLFSSSKNAKIDKKIKKTIDNYNFKKM